MGPNESIKHRYIIHTIVKRLYESFDHRESRGWFVTFEGSSESLYLGTTRPFFEENDHIRITIEKR